MALPRSLVKPAPTAVASLTMEQALTSKRASMDQLASSTKLATSTAMAALQQVSTMALTRFLDIYHSRCLVLSTDIITDASLSIAPPDVQLGTIVSVHHNIVYNSSRIDCILVHTL